MNGSFLTLEQAKSLIKTKEHLYNAMIRNQWFLPKFKSSIISQDYLKGVRDGQIWCPKYLDLKIMPCPDPPPKDLLIDQVLKASNNQKLHLGIDNGKVPDRDWLIKVLALLNKDHEIFRKDYIPPIQDRQKREKVIDNSDGFYSDLPLLYKKRDMKGRSKLKVYQLSREEETIKQLKEKKALIEKRIVQRADRVKQIEKQNNTVLIDKDELKKLKQRVQTLEKDIAKKQRGKTPTKGQTLNE